MKGQLLENFLQPPPLQDKTGNHLINRSAADLLRVLLLPLHDLGPCLLVHPVVNIDHGLNGVLGSLPALATESVVELLGGWVLPVGLVISLGAGDR